MPLCVLYGAFYREISQSSLAILGFLLVYLLFLVFPSVMTKPEGPIFSQEAKQYILLAYRASIIRFLWSFFDSLKHKGLKFFTRTLYEIIS